MDHGTTLPDVKAKLASLSLLYTLNIPAEDLIKAHHYSAAIDNKRLENISTINVILTKLMPYSCYPLEKLAQNLTGERQNRIEKNSYFSTMPSDNPPYDQKIKVYTTTDYAKENLTPCIPYYPKTAPHQHTIISFCLSMQCLIANYQRLENKLFNIAKKIRAESNETSIILILSGFDHTVVIHNNILKYLLNAMVKAEINYCFEFNNQAIGQVALEELSKLKRVFLLLPHQSDSYTK